VSYDPRGLFWRQCINRGTSRNLKPGGWVEIQDIFPRVSSDDNTIPPDYPIIKFYAMMKTALRDKYGFDLGILEHLPDLLESVGFVNVHRKVYHMPLGEWARDAHLRLLGGYFREVLLDLMGAMATRPLIEAGYEKEELEDMVREATAAASNRKIHAYLPIHFVWAQKPPV
jgi:hypothetical protein